ncbi:DUF1538 family protein [uncultured Streptococcus sp.]|uniref:DUF1538 family protein n=1 Tax=uncultured Streptococcus sp. TaxID=83427 RepID=UPI002582B2B3|nr:DUF1538 family protein [uncultured Streptococcus sp.]
MFKNILLKSKESAFSILPVFLLVIILNFTPWLDLSGRDILIFVITTLILLIGMSLFNLGADIAMTPMGKKTVRWIKPEDLDERMSSSRNILAKDRFDQPVFLFENDFALRWFADKYPEVELEEKM